MDLGWPSTKSDGLRRPDVGPHHICLARKSRPKRRKQKVTGEGQQVQAGAGAGKLASGCLPRIHLFTKRLTKQSWSLTLIGLISRLRERSGHLSYSCVSMNRQK